MSKLLSSSIISIMLVALALVYPVTAEPNAITNVEFAELLVNVLNIELPAGTEALSDQEYYEVVANILASRGIGFLVDLPASGTMTAGTLADVAYALVGGTDNLTSNQKIDYLVIRTFMENVDANSTVSLTFASDTLNNPAFIDAVAEAYEGTEGGDIGDPLAGGGGPGPIPEDTAS
ncbi:MAG: hypothetical protein HQ579_06300 [Candidatus Omnitrophica bacterium]|nr:hypothetical protein [Candidatus Omnitrophota bacterium]